MDEKELIRHFLSTIYYRGMKYLSVEDRDFNSYQPVTDTRSPAQILNHINGLLLYIGSHFVNIPDTFPEQLPFIDEVKRFDRYIRELDGFISVNDIEPPMTWGQILQGPMADIMLHIGELSMQRKVSGRPAYDIENYIFADIKTGVFGGEA